jgi:hypothetical protein
MKLDVRVYVRSKEDSFYRETDLRSNNAAAVDGLVGEGIDPVFRRQEFAVAFGLSTK